MGISFDVFLCDGPKELPSSVISTGTGDAAFRVDGSCVGISSLILLQQDTPQSIYL